MAHASVSNSKAALTLQKQRTRNAVTAWRHRVDECRARMRSERAAHDQQMATIVSSLLAFEEQLKQEQKTIVKTLEEKGSQIVAQQRRIESLTTANERLMKVFVVAVVIVVVVVINVFVVFVFSCCCRC